MEPEEPGYAGAPVAGAVLATLFFPFLSLIVALVLQGGQVDPVKRSQLRTWAWASGSWLIVGAVMVLLLAGIGTGSGSGF
jgi:fumarate reductase subunit D